MSYANHCWAWRLAISHRLLWRVERQNEAKLQAFRLPGLGAEPDEIAAGLKADRVAIDIHDRFDHEAVGAHSQRKALCERPFVPVRQRYVDSADAVMVFDAEDDMSLTHEIATLYVGFGPLLQEQMFLGPEDGDLGVIDAHLERRKSLHVGDCGSPRAQPSFVSAMKSPRRPAAIAALRPAMRS
jgi:hypothetical protein